MVEFPDYVLLFYRVKFIGIAIYSLYFVSSDTSSEFHLKFIAPIALFAALILTDISTVSSSRKLIILPRYLNLTTKRIYPLESSISKVLVSLAFSYISCRFGECLM